MAFSHMLVGASAGSENLVIRRIAPSDLFDALARGIDDFVAMPSHAVFLCVIYPLLGIALIGMTLGNSMLPLAFPIAAGFALVGPLAAIGLYELSRRREAGLDSSTSHALDVLHSPSLGGIVALGLLLMAVFLIWLAVADAIYIAYFGYHGPASIGRQSGHREKLQIVDGGPGSLCDAGNGGCLCQIAGTPCRIDEPIGYDPAALPAQRGDGYCDGPGRGGGPGSGAGFYGGHGLGGAAGHGAHGEGAAAMRASRRSKRRCRNSMTAERNRNFMRSQALGFVTTSAL